MSPSREQAASDKAASKFEEYRERLQKHALRVGLPAADAADVAQRTLIKAVWLVTSGRVMPDELRVPGAWLNSILDGEILHFRRGRSREASKLTQFSVVESVRQGVSRDMTTERVAMRRALSQLETRERVAFWLVECAEATQDEAAEVLAVSRTSVANLLRSATKNLKKMAGTKIPRRR